jgi:hypothetical protein
VGQSAEKVTVSAPQVRTSNIPGGYRALETYTIHGLDDIEEVFELAEPGKGFTAYSRARLTRVR